MGATAGRDTADSRVAVRRRMEALADEIRHHDYLYYVLDRPEISDAAYDALFHELVHLEKTHPDLVSLDSPTRRVAGTPIDFLPGVRHLAPMLSLESATDPAGSKLGRAQRLGVQVISEDEFRAIARGAGGV